MTCAKNMHPVFHSDSMTPASSVVGIQFNEGVVIAADMLVSYGNNARYQEVHRVIKINKNIVMGAGGDFADVQQLLKVIEERAIEDDILDDNYYITADAMFSYVTRELYNRRSAKEPLDVEVVMGGNDINGEPFLGVVNGRGSAYQSFVSVTGFGRVIAAPIIYARKPPHRDFTLPEVINLLEDCMRILYYRDTHSIRDYLVGICTPKRCLVAGPFQAEEHWELAYFGDY